MQDMRLSRRDILKVTGVMGGLAIAAPLLGRLTALADDVPVDEPLGPFGPWGTPTQIAELASSANDFHPSVSRDGSSLFFTTDRATSPLTEIWVSQSGSALSQWGPPAAVASLNASHFNTGVPDLTTSRHVVYFQSNRPGGAGAGDLWQSRRQDKTDDFGWQRPIPVPGIINTGASESAATYFEDSSGAARLYFARFEGVGAFGEAGQDFDIYVSFQDADGNFGPGQIVSALNAVPQAGDQLHTWSRDTRTAIRRDGLEMFITSNRHGGLSYSGGPVENLWVSTRTDTANEDWSVPQLADGLNSGFGDGGPALSWDATTIYFFSQRTGSSTPGKRQLWTASRERL